MPAVDRKRHSSVVEGFSFLESASQEDIAQVFNDEVRAPLSLLGYPDGPYADPGNLHQETAGCPR